MDEEMIMRKIAELDRLWNREGGQFTSDEEALRLRQELHAYYVASHEQAKALERILHEYCIVTWVGRFREWFLLGMIAANPDL